MITLTFSSHLTNYMHSSKIYYVIFISQSFNPSCEFSLMFILLMLTVLSSLNKSKVVHRFHKMCLAFIMHVLSCKFSAYIAPLQISSRGFLLSGDVETSV